MGDRVSFPAAPGRLDAVLAARLGLSRADAQRAISRNLVLVDGVPREKSHRLHGAETIEAELSPPGELAPERESVPVVYQDESILILSKPAGLVTHPTASRRTGTLVNRLLALGVPLSRGGTDRPGIVHRLDAGTSGLMVVAKDDATHDALSEMFRRHSVERRYLALVRGHVAHDAFLIDAPLERRRGHMAASAGARRQATTDVLVRRRLRRATFLEAAPRTGRTHQIRVHLAASGHPILGDRAYGGGGDDAAHLGLRRPFLHSWRLGLQHPHTGQRIDLEDPLPPDLDEALEKASTP